MLHCDASIAERVWIAVVMPYVSNTILNPTATSDIRTSVMATFGKDLSHFCRPQNSEAVIKEIRRVGQWVCGRLLIVSQMTVMKVDPSGSVISKPRVFFNWLKMMYIAAAVM